jgi:DNA-directed RNA polymerase specialized sigma24 family protein
MARAKDGDRQAYRLLLEDMTPYLRSLALHCFKEPSDIEDSVDRRAWRSLRARNAPVDGLAAQA